MLLPAGQQAAKQGLLIEAVNELALAGPYGWLPLTAVHLHANQLQPALLLLQHAVALAIASEGPASSGTADHSYTNISADEGGFDSNTADVSGISDDSKAVGSGVYESSKAAADQCRDGVKAFKGVEWMAAQQLAEQWASLIVSIVEECEMQKTLTLLVFPAADAPQLGSSEVRAHQIQQLAHDISQGLA